MILFYQVPRELHRKIVGKNGKNVHQMEQEYGVKINRNGLFGQSDGIEIRGAEENCERARQAILSLTGVCDHTIDVQV